MGHERDVSMIWYREIEGWADSLKYDVFTDGLACLTCKHSSYSKNDPERGVTSRDCNARQSLQCDKVAEAVGYLHDDLGVALQEIDFD
jgi:hypothetical protein